VRQTRRPAVVSPELFEPLESRLALYTSPLLVDLPASSSMSSTQNTVVRLLTSEGVIDIELYDREGPGAASAAPITTANFLNYVNSGRYDSTFFHRLVATPTPFVLQGGGFAFVPPTTAQSVVTDPSIQNEFDLGRSNIERTIAMAKLGGDPNSATSQFFFNLGNNASNLDFQNGGFTVFGKVIGGWDVVQAITGFAVQNLNSFFTSGQQAFDSVPVRPNTTNQVVTIIDAEVIKPGGQTEFFTAALYYPEGYRSSRIVANVDLLNEDVNGSVAYEIIARFETGQRDKVISSGTLAAGARLTVPISRGGDPSINNVRANTPFAYEIRATGPVAATLHHKDYGAVGSEAFLDPMQLSEAQLREWSFADGIKGPGIPAFLVWESLSGQSAVVTVTFTTETGQSFSFDKTLEPFRRGGLNLNDVTGLPTGLFSVKVSSTRPIVASLSQYRAAPGRASTELGMLEGGASEAVLPAGMIPTDGQSLLSLYYQGTDTSPVTVTISFVLTNGTVLQGGNQQLSATDRRRDFDLSVLNGALPRDEFFTIRYTVSGGERVAGGYTSITAGDTVRTAFQSVSSDEVYFAGGFTDPASPGREVLSLYNPYTGNITIGYRLRFQFVDDPQGDEVVYSQQGDILAGRRVDIDIDTLSEVMAKINAGSQFRRYSITVETDITDGTTPVVGAVWGQLTRIGMVEETLTYGPTLSHTQAPLAPGVVG
jgi:cyclophilin family peptidyl-prolyl cis-trans isomerase